MNSKKPRKKAVKYEVQLQPLVGMDKWVAETAEALARTLLVKVGDQEKLIGPEYRKALTAQVMSAYIAGCIMESLQNGGKSAEKTMREFGEMKSLIQMAVAGGFEAALGSYSGEFLEYYCIIKPVPEPLSDMVN
jgi:hypothetical protein